MKPSARPLSIALVLACAGIVSTGARPDTQIGYDIDTLAIRAITRVLSHDSLLGRATGSDGSRAAAQHIAEACRVAGLDPLEGRYLHPVPLAQAVLDSEETQITLRTSQRERSFAAPQSFLPLGITSSTLRGFRGRAIFVGATTDIFELRGDLTGAVAVTSEPLLGAAAADTLRSHGAVGIVSLTTRPAQQFIEQLRGRSPLHVTDTMTSSFFPALPTAAAWTDVSQAMVDMATVNSRAGLPVDMGVDIDVRVAFQPNPVRSDNVACILHGRAAATNDSAIVFTAHYDHLGVREPDATGDSIYNGFSDNAAGVAMLLGIAEALASRPVMPRHSMLFLFFTGEEVGLLGSDFYVAHPAWPLERTIGVINLDAGAPPALARTWRIAGGNESTLGTLATDIAATQGWSATTSDARPNSDYYGFWRHGVPSIFVVPGTGPYQGLSIDSSQALRDRWDRYHQPGDEWFEDFPFEGIARYAEYAFRIADALDRGGPPRR